MNEKTESVNERLQKMMTQIENEFLPIIDRAIWRRNHAIELCKKNIADWKGRKQNILFQDFSQTQDMASFAIESIDATIESFTEILKTLEGELDE